MLYEHRHICAFGALGAFPSSSIAGMLKLKLASPRFNPTSIVICFPTHRQFLRQVSSTPRKEPRTGTTTPSPDPAAPSTSKSPFYFDVGYALFAKRPSRPFPPPFASPPSDSFSDPLSTHNRSRDRRPHYNGELIRGITNGDDAVVASENFIGANDGVGAWDQKPQGHAALWSRLILHFWALEAEKDSYGSSSSSSSSSPNPVDYLQRAYELTKEATSHPNQWHGTTTASGAILYSSPNATPPNDSAAQPRPVLSVAQLGDSQILVIRPRTRATIYKTKEQWHWFDCPRQLGTNSPDTPRGDAVLDRVEIEEDDVVLAMSDGVVDNLWEHEVVDCVLGSVQRVMGQEVQRVDPDDDDDEEVQLDGVEGIQEYKGDWKEGMKFVAEELVKAARVIAEDPFAESPYMERAVEEGLAMEGGKLDDISVVAALCRRRKI